MERASWWLPRPDSDPDPDTRRAFDQLYAEAVAAGPSRPVDYRLTAPRWQFLCHLGDSGLVLMHGSGREDIAVFEPRQSKDVTAFGAQRGVYASSDGIWSTFFAVIDRDRYQGTLVNGCFRPRAAGGSGYYFSLNAGELARRPWRDGTVYLLPPDGFLAQEGESDSLPTQFVSLQPVVPLARIAVSPADFPFLGQVRGHDEVQLRRRASADPAAFPWLEE